MPSVLSQLLRRPQGTGWLILSGGPTPEELIRRALALVEHAGILAAVVPSPRDLPDAEVALEGWIDVSGWEGRSVDCDSSDAIEDVLSEASLVLLPDLADTETLTRSLGQTDANEFLLAALDAGVVIVAEGAAAESLGEQITAGGGQSGAPGLGWIPGAIIQTHFSEEKTIAPILNRNDRFRIGLPEGVSIALGPELEREIWGEGKPTITFREWWKA
ncbi:MAG: hypothetical protein WBM17_09615 [Anaerolineales bacterium]